MSDYLKAACEHVGATPEQVLAHRVDSADQVFVLVVDNGIKGAPKYEIPLSELITVASPVESNEPEQDADSQAEKPAPKARARKGKK